MLGGVLILVRHGRTAANAEGRLQGRLDLELDEVGLRQAIAVAELVLCDTTVDAVISSPLQRATQTADRFGMPYDVDERWIELAYGEWEGKPHKAVPEAWARWKQDPGYVPEGGESLAALARLRRKWVGSFCDLPRVASAARTYPGLISVAPPGLRFSRFALSKFPGLVGL